MCDELCESLTFLPPRPQPWIWISKPSERSVQKFICRRSTPAGTLPVKGPAKNKLRRTILFSSHPSKPMVDQRRLSGTGPGNDSDYVHLWVRQGCIQECQVSFAPEKLFARHGQSGYRNALWCSWYYRDLMGRSAMEHLSQAAIG